MNPCIDSKIKEISIGITMTTEHSCEPAGPPRTMNIHIQLSPKPISAMVPNATLDQGFCKVPNPWSISLYSPPHVKNPFADKYKEFREMKIIQGLINFHRNMRIGIQVCEIDGV